MWQRVSPAIERFGVAIPLNPLQSAAVLQALEELTRERCDQTAIVNLGKALQSAGQRRDAGNAHLRFSESCGGHFESLQAAANIFLGIADYERAAEAATAMTALEPLNDNGYFLRAVAYDRSGQSTKAVDDYTTAIELFTPKHLIADVSFVGLARNYEKMGQPCDAAAAIESWVAIKPNSYETAKTRSIIASYESKGKCASATADKEEVFVRPRHGEVVTLPVTINGVPGRFILDTGASFVSLKASFATKAKVEIEQDSKIRLFTANGVSEGHRGRAAAIQLRSLRANDVPLVVQSDAKGTYGPKVDGLLGMSFLSRFHIALDGKAVRIRKRAKR
jgi:clan AA aspartic protease (TIGR02281 family)